MTSNKLLSFLLAGSLLGHTVPAHSMHHLRKVCQSITAGIGASAIYYGSTSYIIDEQRKDTKKYFQNRTQEEKKGQLEHNINFWKNHIITKLIEKDNVYHFWDNERKELDKNQFPEGLRNSLMTYHGYKNQLNDLPYKFELQKQLQDFADENHRLKDVFFEITSAKHGWGAAHAQRVIVIPESDKAYLLKKIKLSKGQNIFNDLDDTRMALISGSLHHECGHLLHESGESNLKIDSLQHAIMAALITFRLGNHSLRNLTLRNLIRPRELFMMGTYYAFSRGITGALNLAFGKYDETRADDTVPNDPRLLKAMENFFRIDAPIHQKETIENSIKPIQEYIFSNYGISLSEDFIKKSLQFSDLAKPLTDVHPSNEFRANRFKARLAALENSNATLKEKSDEK